jgi:hypothetical protein
MRLLPGESHPDEVRHDPITYSFESFDRNAPRKPRLVGGVKGHNMNDNTLPGSPAL